MEGQKKTQTTQMMREKLDEFQVAYGNNVSLFSLESSVTKDQAIKLYENFDTFISRSASRLKSAHKSEILNIITEIIHYFNVALQLFPSLSSKSGDFLKFIEQGIRIGGDGGGWHSYSLQFGLPAGVSLALHFDSKT